MTLGKPSQHEKAGVAKLSLSHAGDQPEGVKKLQEQLTLLGDSIVTFTPARLTVGEFTHAVYNNEMPPKSETGVNPLEYADELAAHAERHRDFLEACNNPEGSFECANNRVVDIFFEYWARKALARENIEINFGGVIKDQRKGGPNDGTRQQHNLTPEVLMRTAEDVLRIAEEAEGDIRPKASVKQEDDGKIILSWQGTWTRGREITVTLTPPANKGAKWVSKFDWKTATDKPSKFLDVRLLGAKIISTRDDDPKAGTYYNFTDIKGSTIPRNMSHAIRSSVRNNLKEGLLNKE